MLGSTSLRVMAAASYNQHDQRSACDIKLLLLLLLLSCYCSYVGGIIRFARAHAWCPYVHSTAIAWRSLCALCADLVSEKENMTPPAAVTKYCARSAINECH
jgi:uncharacterized membrane protein